MSPTLLGLPREVRDNIYEFLSNVTEPSGNPLPLRDLPSGTRRFTNGVHSLLGVNRLLREEALDHAKNCDTYLVSQRYRAFAGLDQMIPWKPAPIPTHARRVYLRTYIAIPDRVARPVTQAIDRIWQESRAARMQGDTWRSLCPKVFDVLTSILRTCLKLEDLILELVLRRQNSPFGQGRESDEPLGLDGWRLTDTCRYEMEQVMRELPRLQKYAIVGSQESRLVRRNAEGEWIRACVIPQCVDTCHCYGSFATTCEEDMADLLGDLTPRSCGQWISASMERRNWTQE